MVLYCSAESHRKAKKQGLAGKASLVICPQILVGHWAFEISKFVDSDVLVPLAYEGSPSQRQAQQTKFGAVDVVIMSYETLRSDSAAILQHSWRYCILDEGHVIRNSKAKISQVILQYHTQEEEATAMYDKYLGLTWDFALSVSVHRNRVMTMDEAENLGGAHTTFWSKPYDS